MAGRKDKQTVEYFPHFCVPKKTLFIIERNFGNDGYAVWFKTLEILGSSERHFFDCRDTEQWLFYVAKMNVSEELCRTILDSLAKLDAISQKMWSMGVIYSENFVKNVKEVYEKRTSKPITSAEIMLFELGLTPIDPRGNSISAPEMPLNSISAPEIQISGGENTRSKEEKSKEEKRVIEKSIVTPANDLSKSNLFRKPNIPTKDDVEMYFCQSGGTVEMATAFFNKNSATEWFLNGSPIMNFRNLVPSFITNWRKNERNKTSASASSSKYAGRDQLLGKIKSAGISKPTGAATEGAPGNDG